VLDKVIVFAMTQKALFIRVLVILEERKIIPSGMPLKRTESAFFEASIFEKSAIKYPVFGVFLPIQDFETLINSHFQILKG